MTKHGTKRINSRRKGKTGELWLAKVLTSWGFPARRGQQRRGGHDSPDVICEALSNCIIEMKYGHPELLNQNTKAWVKVWSKLEAECASTNATPLFFHRPPRTGLSRLRLWTRLSNGLVVCLVGPEQIVPHLQALASAASPSSGATPLLPASGSTSPSSR